MDDNSEHEIKFSGDILEAFVRCLGEERERRERAYS